MTTETTRATDRGFTLIEVLIAVAIVGIVAAIAIPSYSTFLEQGRRSDAIAFLTEAAGEQVRFFTENNEYAEDMTTLGYGIQAFAFSDEGHYRITIDRPDAGAYTMTATPVADGPQAGDTACGEFSINSRGVRGNSVTGADCW